MSDLIGIKIRLYPTKNQKKQLDQSFGNCRFLYNQMLNERQTVYNRLKNKPEELKYYKYKTEKEYKALFPFLKETSSSALHDQTHNLLCAFSNFFRTCKTTHHYSYPKFKSRKGKQAFAIENGYYAKMIDFTNHALKLPKMKQAIKYSDPRVFSEAIHQISVSKTKSGNYYASLLLARENNTPYLKEIKQERIIAFDMAMRAPLISDQSIADLNSNKLENPRFFRKALNKIQRAQRHLSRTKKGSANHEKARLRVARVYEHFVRQKNDWMHKFTNKLVKNYDAICVEDLNIEGMKRYNKCYAKSITLDFSWSEFIRQLSYKMQRKGKYLQKVGRFFPSSKLCSVCSYKNTELSINQHEWICPECGTLHDRDINASHNILKEGLRLLQSEQYITLIQSSTVKATERSSESYACGDFVNLQETGVEVDETKISQQIRSD